MSNIPFKIPEKVEISAGMKNLLKIMCEVNVKERIGKEDFMKLDLKVRRESPKAIYFSNESERKSVHVESAKKLTNFKQYRATSI